MKLKSHQHRHLYKHSTLTQLLTTLVISKMNDRPMYVNNNNSYTFGLLIKKKKVCATNFGVNCLHYEIKL